MSKGKSYFLSDEKPRVEDLIDDVEPENFWEEKQKEIVTSVVDYNLDTLDNLIRKGLIDLKPKYQRRQRWDDTRKSRLIESFFMNVPVPPIFLNEDSYGKYSVIDGKQRLLAVSDFLNDRFMIVDLKIFQELNGVRFSDLSEELKSVITTRPTLRAVIILRQSDPDIKIEVFDRLNTGGIKLNAQEIRNSAHTGKFNDLIIELSEDKTFRKLLGITSNSSAIYKEMKDVELVLRFFAFKDSWSNFSGGIAKSLDVYMQSNRSLDENVIVNFKLDFLETIRKIDSLFENTAFRRWNPESQKWRAPILSALYDAQMIAVRDFSYHELMNHKESIQNGMKELFNSEEFQKNIMSAIPNYFIRRIEKMKEMIREKLDQ